MNKIHPQFYNTQSDPPNSTPAQTDSGANIGITPTIEILTNFQQIQPFPVGHATNGPPMYGCGKGDLSITKNDGHNILIPMYYSPPASGTIISPDNICSSPCNSFHKFVLESNLENGSGTMSFLSHNAPPCTLETQLRNGL